MAGTLGIIGGVAAFFHAPWVGVPAIAAGISAIWAGIAALLGYTLDKWVRDVVMEKYSGDGWLFVDRNVDKKCALTWPWYPTWQELLPTYEKNIRQYWYYNDYTRKFKQTFGSQGIWASPSDYTVQWTAIENIRWKT